jgi:hypothetical protein
MKTKLTNRPVEKVIASIRALDLESVKIRLMDPELGEGWTREYAEGIEQGYRTYLTMLAKYQEHAEDILLSKDVDEFWHTHILQTIKYTEDCERVFGSYLHHNPHVGERKPEDLQKRTALAEKTRRLYRQEFGNADSAAWVGATTRNAAWSAAAIKTEGAAWSAAMIKAEGAAWSAAVIKAEGAAWSAAAIKTEGAAWSAAVIKAEGAAWSAAVIKAEGAAWSAAVIKAEGAAWSAAVIKTEGAAWSAAAIKTEGAAWSAAVIKTEGAAWSAAVIKTEGAAWSAAVIKPNTSARSEVLATA